MKTATEKTDLGAIKEKIANVNDWPKENIDFKDITPLLADKKLFRTTINMLAKEYVSKNISKIVGLDARGFIFAAALAYELDAGLVIARKKGKLPRETISREYGLEYGKATLEIHKDAIEPGENILIVDDVLATGGTMAAAVGIVEELKGNIRGLAFLIELTALGGREKLNGYEINTLIEY